MTSTFRLGGGHKERGQIGKLTRDKGFVYDTCPSTPRCRNYIESEAWGQLDFILIFLEGVQKFITNWTASFWPPDKTNTE